MASAKPTHEILSAIRRSTCYDSGRTILLVISVIMALLALVAGTALFTLLDKEQPMAVLLSASVVIGGALMAFLVNYLGNVYIDGADALLQIAKFEQRGHRARVEALELARKATQEQEEEENLEAPKVTQPESRPMPPPKDMGQKDITPERSEPSIKPDPETPSA